MPQKRPHYSVQNLGVEAFRQYDRDFLHSFSRVHSALCRSQTRATKLYDLDWQSVERQILYIWNWEKLYAQGVKWELRGNFKWHFSSLNLCQSQFLECEFKCSMMNGWWVMIDSTLECEFKNDFLPICAPKFDSLLVLVQALPAVMGQILASSLLRKYRQCTSTMVNLRIWYQANHRNGIHMHKFRSRLRVGRSWLCAYTFCTVQRRLMYRHFCYEWRV